MHAAAAGNSTIGIPQSVGEEFSAADHARGPAKLPNRVSGSKKHPSQHNSTPGVGKLFNRRGFTRG
jgi:hypothetical protein